MGALPAGLPGPRGLPLVGLLPRFRRDPLRLLEETVRHHGPLCSLPLGPVCFLLVHEPAWIEQVLVVQHARFRKGRALQGPARRLLGNCLLTSEGDFWLRQRRLIQPAFHKQRLATYGAAMVELTLRHIQGWKPGDRRDVAREMMRLTLAIAARTLFGADVQGEADAVGEALTVAMEYLVHRTRSLLRVPETWPTPANRRALRAVEHLNAILYRIIGERRRTGEDTGDLLSMLIHAVDEGGGQMTPEQLRDEAMTIFLAGHETTANALAWTIYLLSQHPEVEERLGAEVDAALGGRPPGVDDLDRLPYTAAVIRESLRLYPPAWLLGRRSAEPFELGGHTFPAGQDVFTSPWVMHRDPRFWEDPLAFRPERWLDGLERRLPRFAYFPFGGGPRVCIGSRFAEMEAALVLAILAQRFRFRLVPGHPVAPQPLVTLRPRRGVAVILQGRP